MHHVFYHKFILKSILVREKLHNKYCQLSISNKNLGLIVQTFNLLI